MHERFEQKLKSLLEKSCVKLISISQLDREKETEFYPTFSFESLVINFILLHKIHLSMIIALCMLSWNGKKMRNYGESFKI